MPLLDLSLVTRSYTELIARQVELSPAWQPRPRPTVSPLAPDQMPGAGLSFYLYHVLESAHARNAPPPHPGAGLVRHTPMGLELHFQMSPVAAGPTANEMHEAQLLFGAALKALHDTPDLDDNTAVNGAGIFQLVGLDGARNRFHLQMQTIPASEAVNYWTAGSTALRLAAYYSAAVIHLEPDSESRRSGRVLSYSVEAFPAGSPFISSTETTVDFTLPGGLAQSVTTSPAVVPLGGRLVVTGSGYTGQAVDLLLRGNSDAVPRVADAGWAVQAGPTRLTATVAPSIDGLAVLPGVYMVMVRTTRMLSGRPVTTRSNATAIQIAPALDTLTDLGGGSFRAEGGLYDDPGLEPDAVEVHVGTDVLGRVNAAPGPGEFRVVSADRIDLALPGGLTPGVTLPLRIFVNGAESPPHFVTAP
ncbi:MAG: Pvc16 family protein [Gemmobacter sp.]